MIYKEIKPLNVVNPELIGKDLVIWGAGDCGHSLFKKICMRVENRCNCIAFCDSNPDLIGEKIYDIEIISPNELQAMDKNTIVLIAVNTYLLYVEIANDLLDMGFCNIYANYAENGLPSKYDTEKADEELQKMKPKINEIWSLLHDNISRRVFEDLIRARTTNDMSYYKHAYMLNDNNHQYFPDSSIFEPCKNEIFLDGGCCNAETIDEFVKWCKNEYSKVYAFEPSHNQCIVCNENIRRKRYRAEIIEAGLNDITTELFFSEGDTQETGFISQTGDYKIKVVSIDDYFKNKADWISFIKMDIEGSELAALMGAERIIGKFHPKLAICIYHRFSDMWEIPLWIHNKFPNYRFYIRHYSFGPSETVLYARWEEKEFCL